MAGKLINDESVMDVNRRMSYLIEEARDALLQLERSINLAEMEGWRDKQYYKVEDHFSIAKKNIKDGLDELDDMAMPIIRNLMKDIEY